MLSLKTLMVTPLVVNFTSVLMSLSLTSLDFPRAFVKLEDYEDDNIKVEHYQPSYGMTFVQIKNLDAIEQFKKNVDWSEVFETRNWLNDFTSTLRTPTLLTGTGYC